MLDDPGPFERIAQSIGDDRELLGHLVYEQGLALSGGLSGLSGRMTDGELRNAALRLATTALAIVAQCGITQPLASVREYAQGVVEQIERERTAA